MKLKSGIKNVIRVKMQHNPASDMPKTYKLKMKIFGNS